MKDAGTSASRCGYACCGSVPAALMIRPPLAGKGSNTTGPEGLIERMEDDDFDLISVGRALIPPRLFNLG